MASDLWQLCPVLSSTLFCWGARHIPICGRDCRESETVSIGQINSFHDVSFVVRICGTGDEIAAELKFTFSMKPILIKGFVFANRIGLSSLHSDDPNTAARCLPKAFTPLRGVRHFHSFAFESKLSTLRNKNASSTSSKRLCEPDWITSASLRSSKYSCEVLTQGL